MVSSAGMPLSHNGSGEKLKREHPPVPFLFSLHKRDK